MIAANHTPENQTQDVFQEDYQEALQDRWLAHWEQREHGQTQASICCCVCGRTESDIERQALERKLMRRGWSLDSLTGQFTCTRCADFLRQSTMARLSVEKKGVVVAYS